MARLTAFGPGELARTLGSLEVQIESARVQRSDVPLPDYPGGPRPSSVVRLGGAGQWGLGEHVGFSPSEHERFVVSVQDWFRARPSGVSARVCDALGAGLPPYARAALEAALIDLGLRQARLSLFDLSGIRNAALRFVVSLAARAEPRRAIESLRAAGFMGDLKLDVDPSWSRETCATLAREPSIAVFDFKGRGDAALARQLAELNQSALFEDPPTGFEVSGVSARRISRDASLSDSHAVATAGERGEAVNLKAPRMGGPLELLRGLERARLLSAAPGAQPAAYFGGMFEVAVGRTQARQLAALYCPDAPNDLATNTPLGASPAPRQNSPLSIRLDSPGFGEAHES